jgi:hypothetical protein
MNRIFSSELCSVLSKRSRLLVPTYIMPQIQSHRPAHDILDNALTLHPFYRAHQFHRSHWRILYRGVALILRNLRSHWETFW